MIHTRVLVIEDDLELQQLYKRLFDRHAREFVLTLVETGDEAVREIKKHPHTPIDIALVDWRLERGSMDGFQVLRFIRSNPTTRSILAFMITGNKNDRDVRAALDAGADDYITKPFREWELLARLRNRIVRRDEGQERHRVFELDGLELDVQGATVTLNGKAVALTATEFGLMELFMRRRDDLLTTGAIWDSVWGYRSETQAVTLSRHICNLRKKLGAWGDRIEARPAQGYLLNSRFPISH